MRYLSARSLLWQFAAVVALAAGCAQNEGMRTANEMVASMKALTELLKSVQDPATAQAAAPQIGPAFQRMFDALDKMLAYEQKNGEVRGMKGSIERLKSDLAQVQNDFKAESERIERLDGLPAEFWGPMREYGAKSILGGLKATGVADQEIISQVEKVIALYASAGVNNTVEFVVANVYPHNHAETIEKCRKLGGPNTQLIEFPDPDRANATIVVMGPVAGFDDVVAKVDFGKVVEQDKGRCEFLLELAPSSEVAATPPPGFDAPTEYGSSNSPADFQSRHEEAQAKMRESLEAAQSRESEMGAGRRRRFESPPSGFGVGASGFDDLDDSDPDYHAQLAKLLTRGGMSDQRDAMEELLHIMPESVADKKVRAEIARGFRDLAVESSHPDRNAIKGLVLWGGKHSVPLLIQILEKQSRMKVDDAVYEGLAKYPTPEGAEAAASRVGNFFDGDLAISCLKRMGPVAEEAVIEIAPSDDLKVNFFAIDFLKDHGTEKSYDILQRARKSPNRDLKEAATSALREIRLREQENKKKKSAA